MYFSLHVLCMSMYMPTSIFCTVCCRLRLTTSNKRIWWWCPLITREQDGRLPSYFQDSSGSLLTTRSCRRTNYLEICIYFTSGSAVADMLPPERLYECIRKRPPCNCENNVSPALTPSMRRIPSSYRVRIWYGKTRIASLQSGENRMMIDSVVWAQYINVTDTQTATQTATWPQHGRQKAAFPFSKSVLSVV